jgi:hypothetical protein
VASKWVASPTSAHGVVRDLQMEPRRTGVKVTRFFHERPWGGLRFTERKTTENATLSTRPEPDKRWIG